MDNVNLGTSAKGIYIKNGGNVGIGTTSPGAKLDVSGNISYTSLKPYGLGAANISCFYVIKSAATGTAIAKDIYKIDPAAIPFAHGIIELTYGTRLQGPSDAKSSVVKKLFGYNKFNGGQIAVTDSSVLYEDAASAANASINAVVVGSGASAYIVLRVSFSTAIQESSFVWGEAKILEMDGSVITKLL
jgi:hypothetical protein